MDGSINGITVSGGLTLPWELYKVQIMLISVEGQVVEVWKDFCSSEGAQKVLFSKKGLFSSPSSREILKFRCFPESLMQLLMGGFRAALHWDRTQDCLILVLSHQKITFIGTNGGTDSTIKTKIRIKF